MFRKMLPIFLILCLSVLGVTNPGIAQEKMDDDMIAQLQSEGWVIVGDGVLRRERQPDQVETFVFGSQGFTWKLRDLRAQYVKLMAAYRVTPTAELRKTIVNHRKEISNTMRMIRRARAAEKLGLVDDDKVSCSINFSYNATAGPRTDVQGTWAEATASFNGNCGFTGEVYTYATADATVNGGPVNQSFTDGPRSGGNVSARAYAAVAGGQSCGSYAYASVTSGNLNPSSYSMSATNANCPPKFNVLISGSWEIDLTARSCDYGSWSASITGGTAPFTYSWKVNGVQRGTGSSFSWQACQGTYTNAGGFNLELRVTDGTGQLDTDSRWISVWEDCTDPCLCPLKALESLVPIEPCY